MTQTPDPNVMPGTDPTPAGPPPAPGPMGYHPPAQPGPMGYTPPPPMRKSGNKQALIIIGVLALVVVGIVAYLAFTRDSSVGNADALQVGDCIDRPDESETITEIQHRPCNTPHDGEVIHNFTSPAGPDEPYPVISGFDDFVLENCIPVFESYVGRDWETDTELNIAWLAPTLAGWTGEDHDRAFTCYVYRLDDAQLIASVKNAGTDPLPTPTP